VIESRRYVWRLPDGRRLTFDRGRLTGIDMPDDERLELDYDGGRLVRVRAEHAVVLDIVWAPGRSGLSEWEADPDRRWTPYRPGTSRRSSCRTGRASTTATPVPTRWSA